jgi:hypothetical protein
MVERFDQPRAFPPTHTGGTGGTAQQADSPRSNAEQSRPYAIQEEAANCTFQPSLNASSLERVAPGFMARLTADFEKRADTKRQHTWGEAKLLMTDETECNDFTPQITRYRAPSTTTAPPLLAYLRTEQVGRRFPPGLCMITSPIH